MYTILQRRRKKVLLAPRPVVALSAVGTRWELSATYKTVYGSVHRVECAKIKNMSDCGEVPADQVEL